MSNGNKPSLEDARHAAEGIVKAGPSAKILRLSKQNKDDGYTVYEAHANLCARAILAALERTTACGPSDLEVFTGSARSATPRRPLPVECCGGGPLAEDCCGFPIKRPGGSVPLAEIPEEVVVHLALATGPDSAAQKVLDEAAEIRARGRVARFLFDGTGLCVQEGVVMNRADGGKQT